LGRYYADGGRKEREVEVSQLGAAHRTRRAIRAALAVALTFAFVLPAAADIRILSSSGGTIGGYLDFFCARQAVGRAGGHRWAMPLGLHAGAEHGAAQPNLRHLARSAPAFMLPSWWTKPDGPTMRTS
jgi:hypothetical protein